MEFAIAFAVTFTSVFLKGLQYKNVQHDMYGHVFVTSFGMAALDFTIIKFISGTTTWTMALFCGAGAAFSMVFSMWFHKRIMLKTSVKKG